MTLEQFLFDHKAKLVMLGLLVGFLTLVGVLPETLLGGMTTYIYAGVVLLGGFVYYRFHWHSRGPRPLNIQRRVQSRDISNPSHKRDLERQMGYTHTTHKSPQTRTAQELTSSPTKNVINKFKKN